MPSSCFLKTPNCRERRRVNTGRHQWLIPVILTTQEAEIRRITVQSQPRQMVHETLSQKNPSQKRLTEQLKG
jgi:hypothetical protein